MRKVLSFVLVLSLVLGSFSMAFAATPAKSGLSDIAGNVNEEAIQVAYDLGIVTGNPDGTFLPAKAVNRAEFAAMITRALAIPDSALAGYKTTTFKDTAGYGWAVPYLAFCNSKGIMLGDGAGNAMPGRTINTNEAVTMVLRAIGYTSNSSELVGTWPSNYVTKAQELGIYDDVAKVVNVDKANAAQIIYNTLTVQKVAVNSDGQTNLLWDDSKSTVPTTLLSSGLNCTSLKGVMGAEFGDDAVINIQKYLGQYGTAYLNKDKEVVAFISDCTQLVGTYNALTGFDAEFNTTDADVDYTNKTATTSSISYFKNGDSKSLPSVPVDGKEYVLYANVTGKTIKEVYSVLEWEVSASDVVSAADVKNIADDQSLLGVDFALDDDDAIDLTTFALIGVASLDDIKAGNVVYVFENKDNEVARVEVGTATVEGIVKNYKGSDNFTINGTKYKNAEGIVNGLASTDKITEDNVSHNVKASLDARGYVYSADQTDNATNNVAVVMASGKAGLDNAARLFTSEGKSKVFNAKNNTVFNDVAAADYELIAYGLNKDGEISSVGDAANFVESTSTTFDSNTVVKYYDTSTKSAVIKSNVVVFTYTTSGAFGTADADYDLTTIDKVAKKDNTTNKVGLLFDDGKVIGILIAKEDAKASSDDTYAVVNKEYLDTDADGDAVYFIEGFADGKAISKFTDSDSKQFDAGKKATTLTAIALYKIDLDADGTVTGVELVKAGATVATTGALTIGSADGRNSITATGTSIVYALSSDVVVYEVTKDGYKVYNGNLNKDWTVVLYNIDKDDNNQYDVVFLYR